MAAAAQGNPVAAARDTLKRGEREIRRLRAAARSAKKIARTLKEQLKSARKAAKKARKKLRKAEAAQERNRLALQPAQAARVTPKRNRSGGMTLRPVAARPRKAASPAAPAPASTPAGTI
ncbi:MAG TPA: hypothetical protein VIX87_12040 [Steroidobacteraceae bacterium]